MDESGTSRVLELYSYKLLVVFRILASSFFNFMFRLVNFFIQTSQ